MQIYNIRIFWTNINISSGKIPYGKDGIFDYIRLGEYRREVVVQKDSMDTKLWEDRRKWRFRNNTSWKKRRKSAHLRRSLLVLCEVLKSSRTLLEREWSLRKICEKLCWGNKVSRTPSSKTYNKRRFSTGCWKSSNTHKSPRLVVSLPIMCFNSSINIFRKTL
jgi:hypothetical protein